MIKMMEFDESVAHHVGVWREPGFVLGKKPLENLIPAKPQAEESRSERQEYDNMAKAKPVFRHKVHRIKWNFQLLANLSRKQEKRIIHKKQRQIDQTETGRATFSASF
jgi:hypothetical protein